MVFMEMRLIEFHHISYARALSLDYEHRQGNGQFFEIQDIGKTQPSLPYLEFGYVEENPLDVYFRKLDTHIRLEEGDAYVLIPPYDVVVNPVRPGIHRRYSVEYMASCASSERIADGLTEEDLNRMDQWNLTLPFIIPESKEKAEIKTMVRRIIEERTVPGEINYFQQCQQCMEMLNMMRSLMFQIYRQDGATPSQRRYCCLAKEYVRDHIDGKITVGEIADYVGIHKNYLTNLFSKCEHMHVMEYVNRTKLNRMMDRMLKEGWSLTKAAAEVGFDNADYVSKIFKKYNGVTITEYRRLHGNPQL